MLFPWSHEKRRQEMLAEEFPAEWQEILSRNVEFFAHLSPVERGKLEDDLRVLVAEKSWEGLGGLVLTDEIRVTVAAQASLLTLALEHGGYPKVGSILVYPAAYVIPGRDAQGYIVTEKNVPVEGEAAIAGTVVLSWEDALAGGRRRGDGHNVVFHEFAHQLDMQDGAADGVPYLDTREQIENWSTVFMGEFTALTSAVANGEATFLDRYGATNAAEFFAVATESFFERGAAMEKSHPKLYEALRGFYKQDPAARDQGRPAPGGDS